MSAPAIRLCGVAYADHGDAADQLCATGFFERVDDSYGDIGQAMEAACGVWLRAAPRCEPPAGGWLLRLMKLLPRTTMAADVLCCVTLANCLTRPTFQH